VRLAGSKDNRCIARIHFAVGKQRKENGRRELDEAEHGTIGRKLSCQCLAPNSGRTVEIGGDTYALKGAKHRGLMQVDFSLGASKQTS